MGADGVPSCSVTRLGAFSQTQAETAVLPAALGRPLCEELGV